MISRFYCLSVLSGKDGEFKKNAQRTLDDSKFGFSGKLFSFRKMMRLKNGKIYDKLLFPGYLFLQTDEADPRNLFKFRQLNGFLKFLPDNSVPQELSGADLEIIRSFLQFGSIQGFVRAKFNENDRIVLLSPPFAGRSGTVIAVNRRNNRVKVRLDGVLGITITDLTYYDIEKEDWSADEAEYRKKMVAAETAS